MKTKKIPSVSTVTKNIRSYAYTAGFTYHPQADGTVCLFDILADYYVFRGSPQRAVQFVLGELHMKKWRDAGYPS